LHVISLPSTYSPTLTGTVFEPQLALNLTVYVPTDFFDLSVNVT